MFLTSFVRQTLITTAYIVVILSPLFAVYKSNIKIINPITNAEMKSKCIRYKPEQLRDCAYVNIAQDINFTPTKFVYLALLQKMLLCICHQKKIC